MAEYICEQCREPIDEQANVCPHCGHEAHGMSGLLGVVLLLTGGLLTMTIIGGIIGLPMMYIGYRGLKRSGNISPAIERPDE